jgi:AraC-like DNA-binding protein
MGLGEKTLRTRVKKISGNTIKEYLRMYRLERAKMLIANNSGTLSQIANAVGFSSASYFSKAYKNYFNETPIETKNKFD